MPAGNACVELAYILCPHGTAPSIGQLIVVGKGDPKLIGGGSNVLTKNSLLGPPPTAVLGCPYAPGGVPSPCTTVVNIVGEATKLKASASGVIVTPTTINVTNPTLGPVPCTIVTEGQNKLVALG